MSNYLIAALLAILSLARTAHAQNEYAETLLIPLSGGAVIQHDQYDGALRRLDDSRRVTSAVRVPKSTAIGTRTRVAVSQSETRLLMLHNGASDTRFPRHRVAILDSVSLREITRLALGDCGFLQSPGSRPLSGPAALLCYESPNPADRKNKTFAFVMIDVDAAKVTGWFDLGGRRHHTSPWELFNGFVYDTLYLRVEPRCDTLVPSIGRNVATVDLGERPKHVIVLIRKPDPGSLAGTGEVWVAGSAADAPKRIATLDKRPESAMLCGDQLTVILRD